jgi:cytoskeletal protein CcmA (bactofilin family)
MFNRKEEFKRAEEISVSNNIIGKGSTIQGDLETHGNVRIEGKIIGNIKTKTKVAIGTEACIEGNILAQNAEIAGEVIGKIEISETLSLKSTCVVNGDIIANKLIVEPGAIFNGTCKMGVKIKEIKLGESQKEVRLDRKPEARAVNA